MLYHLHQKWIDKNNNDRMYYSDFYLPDYDIYLDPKNPYCMELDKEKMKYFENKIKIYYGDIDNLIENINILL